jgi:hypothetical protein
VNRRREVASASLRKPLYDIFLTTIGMFSGEEIVVAAYVNRENIQG